MVVKQQQFTYELYQEIPTDVESYVRANAKVLSGVSVNLVMLKLIKLEFMMLMLNIQERNILLAYKLVIQPNQLPH